MTETANGDATGQSHAMYEQIVKYVASQNNRIGVVNLPVVLDMIQ